MGGVAPIFVSSVRGGGGGGGEESEMYSPNIARMIK
jgi:hypothetical protein